ncbi:AAA family ATPase [Metallosphaera javensis (ex Sakai et al. 2022)]|uniref:AAA family ATPase n=1 Tax=Metallosphaera javensis (ex Sakai et al. 2022) TaxID=2775498 RepID=UPI0025837F03|nr:MAG: ATPase [Metallosphaera javensis (ex Sakai et al. 2022)]
MLFDPAPKEDRRDFFDRESELKKLKALSSPIALTLGLRRTGKSSLIRIALKELSFPSIYLDLRRFDRKVYISYRDFLQEVQREVNRLTRADNSLLNFLKHVQGVSILGNEVRFKWGKDERLSFSSLLEGLEGWAEERVTRVILAMDEAQELRRLRGANLLPSLAYSYDNLRNVRFILGGSEMGLLYDYLRVEDPSGPLYGRAFLEVKLSPFSREEAIGFLRRGFQEHSVPFDKHEMVYERIGGIPGWLTYFGYYYVQERDLNASLQRALQTAKRLIRQEFENFLRDKSLARERYLTVMRVISRCASWGEVKNALEAREGVEISDSEISNFLRQLMRASWIVKENGRYCPAEPLVGITFSG